MLSTVEATIARLVALHGEEPPCPSRHDWERIFELGDGQPIHIVNLLAFTDAEAYGLYQSKVARAFVRAGGERVFFGVVGAAFGLDARDAWDATVVTRYPSAAALAGMWLDDEFVAAHAHRLDGLVRSQVLVFGA